MRRGCFITFEGGEGSGKSTQIALLTKRLQAAGVETLALREPGGTFLGDRVRALLLDPEHPPLDAWAELFLYEASRAQIVMERIEPALAQGTIVVCDRFTDSTLAYQGEGRGLPVELVARLNEAASHGLVPDLTVLLDVDPVLGLERATGEGADRLEREDVAFHTRVRRGFLALAEDEPDRIQVVDATASVAEVAGEVWAEVGAWLSAAGVLD